jgi:anti-anti-sigma factor
VREPFRADSPTRCSVRRDGSVLHLLGDIDVGNWATVRERVAAEVGSGVRTLDLTAVRYFGAAGVRAVLDARPSGAVLTVRCAPAVYRVMRISDLLDAEGLVVTEAATERRSPAEAGE